MRVIKDVSLLQQGEHGKVVLTLGNFDGIHLGHQEILKQVVAKARQINGTSMVFTFQEHPLKVLTANGPELLTTFDEKFALLENLGIETLAWLPFTKEFAVLSAERFVSDIIYSLLHPSWIMVGHDYAFGRDRSGNSELLKRFLRKYNYQVKVIKAVKIAGNVVSSTLIRQKIADGRVNEAAQLLGRPYSIQSEVIKGQQKGKNLNFRTANLAPLQKQLPGCGVYAVMVNLDTIMYQGVANIGYQPTYGSNKFQIEVHLIDYDADLYGRLLQVSFIEKIRDELKFASEVALNRQITEDVKKARQILNTEYPSELCRKENAPT